MEISLCATLFASTTRWNLCEILNVRGGLNMLVSCINIFFICICGNNVLIDWLIIKVRDFHVPACTSCSADGVQAGCDKEIDKANGNKKSCWFMFQCQKKKFYLKHLSLFKLLGKKFHIFWSLYFDCGQ